MNDCSSVISYTKRAPSVTNNAVVSEWSCCVRQESVDSDLHPDNRSVRARGTALARLYPKASC
jgi:hypothetical protein